MSEPKGFTRHVAAFLADYGAGTRVERQLLRDEVRDSGSARPERRHLDTAMRRKLRGSEGSSQGNRASSKLRETLLYLEQEGLIQRADDTVIVLNPAALRTIAGDLGVER